MIYDSKLFKVRVPEILYVHHIVILINNNIYVSDLM